MSYQSTSIVMYGVKLSHSEAKQLTCLTDPESDSCGEIPFDKKDGYLPVSTPPWNDRVSEFNGRRSENPIFCTELRSENTDSRIHSLYLEDDENEPEFYVFGIYVGSKGYAYNDDVVSILQNPVPQKVIDNWNKYCKEHTDKSPKYHLVTQVW